MLTRSQKRKLEEAAAAGNATHPAKANLEPQEVKSVVEKPRAPIIRGTLAPIVRNTPTTWESIVEELIVEELSHFEEVAFHGPSSKKEFIENVNARIIKLVKGLESIRGAVSVKLKHKDEQISELQAGYNKLMSEFNCRYVVIENYKKHITKLQDQIDSLVEEIKCNKKSERIEDYRTNTAPMIGSFTAQQKSWSYEDSGKLMPCPHEYSKQLNLHLLKGTQVFDLQMNMGGSIRTYSIDLANMTQTNKSTNCIRKLTLFNNTLTYVFRQSMYYAQIAHEHLYQPTIIYRTLLETSEEYNTVASDFLHHAPSNGPSLNNEYKIESIIAASNPHLALSYCAKKCLLNTPTEVMLWHGSKRASAREVVRDGFQLKYANPDGYFGRGLYFAYYPGYSVSYCRPELDQQTNKIVYEMMYVKVNLGKMYCHSLDYRQSGDIAAPDNFDSVFSVVNKSEDPIFAVYDNAQAYVGYIVRFSKK
jgi:hypothetical protein